MLYNGEQVGDGTGPECDVAVDPIDGTTLTAQGHEQRGLGASRSRPRGTMFDPSRRASTWTSSPPAPRPPTSSTSASPPPRTSRLIAKAKGGSARGRHRRRCSTGPRHQKLIDEIRAAGARIRLIADGDVAGAISAARPRQRRRPAARHRRHARGDHHRRAR